MLTKRPEAFQARALPAAEEIAAEARAARVAGKSPQAAARELHVATAERFHPVDPELILFLASLPPEEVDGIRVNYRARLVRSHPVFIETIIDEEPEPALV